MECGSSLQAGRRLGGAFAASVFIHLGGLAAIASPPTPGPLSEATTGPLQLRLVPAVLAATTPNPPQAAKPAPTMAPEDKAPSGHNATDFAPDFFPNAILDREATPISTPNPSKYLAGSDIPTVPFHLRLFVDRFGQVVDVRLLQPSLIDEAEIQPIKAMFMATPYIPGKLNDREVPSYQDIEVLAQSFDLR
jgi:hypothetical protein